MTGKENQVQLEEMLEEVRRIRKELSGLSESARVISIAIESILADEMGRAENQTDDQYLYEFREGTENDRR
jgi:hypothetical protein